MHLLITAYACRSAVVPCWKRKPWMRWATTVNTWPGAGDATRGDTVWGATTTGEAEEGESHGVGGEQEVVEEGVRPASIGVSTNATNN